MSPFTSTSCISYSLQNLLGYCMRSSQTLDALVKQRLKLWPQRPPGVKPSPHGADAWLRGRPSDDTRGQTHPFLKLPGSTRWRTLPDGLWLHFGGNAVEPFVDIFGIM
jgi:hypothetical protein